MYLLTTTAALGSPNVPRIQPTAIGWVSPYYSAQGPESKLGSVRSKAQLPAAFLKLKNFNLGAQDFLFPTGQNGQKRTVVVFRPLETRGSERG